MQISRGFLPARVLVSSVLALLLTALLATGAEAGENRWTPISLGEGLIAALAADPDTPGVVYAATNLGGIYRSTDAARTWQWRGARTASLDFWTDLIVAPDDPQRLYATTQHTQQNAFGRVYKSGDGGAHWQELFRRQAGFNAVAASANGTLLVAGREAEVHRSVDGGRTWTQVLDLETGTFNLLRLAFDPLAPETAYAGAPGGLWQSTDGGATWRRIGTGPDGQPVADVRALAFPGTRPGFLYARMRNRLFRSEDGGLTWSGGAELSGGFSRIAVDPADPQTVYVTANKLFVSHDGGETATGLAAPFEDTVPLAAAISPADPGTLYVSFARLGVAASTDGGEHWTVSDQRGLSAHQVVPGSFLAAPSGRLYHQPHGNGILYRSLDRGASWSPLTPFPGPLFGLTEEAGAPDRLWAASNPMFQSTDGGASWSRVPLPIAASHVASPAPRVVLAGSCGLVRSADGGRTWTQQFTCDTDAGNVDFVRRLSVPPGWRGAVFAQVDSRRAIRTTYKVLFSEDSGRTWRMLTQTNDAFTVLRAAGSRGVIYLQRNNTLQRSDDEGQSWSPVAVPGPFLSVAVDAADPDLLYLATKGRGVLRSADGGRTWSEINAGLARLGRLWIFDVVTDPKVPFTAYAFPAKGGIFQGRFGE